MSDASTVGVIGSDGNVPVYEPDALWKIWDVASVWSGTTGASKYVPKVRDYVIDPETFETWIVLALDEVTLIPTLKQIRPANMSYSFTENDVLFGTGMTTPSDIFRVYYDKSTYPYTLSVDTHLPIPGSLASYAKIFIGTDLSSAGDVISRVYDSSGNYITDKVGLELASINNHDNISIKIVKACKTLQDLPDGEVVVLVVYSDNGHVVYKRQLIVENTTFIRSVDQSVKYITNISLDCPFISASNDHEILFPLNLPFSALNLSGVVHYSDGSTLTLGVDGSKFVMDGLDQAVSTIVDQKLELVLRYKLSDDEAAYGSSVNGYITEPYTMRVADTNNSYAVKVFGYPEWIDTNNGYKMKWFMTNLDRNVFYDVTDYVEFAENTGSFNPKGYGYSQQKSISLNLRNVSAGFKAFVHTQLVEIILQRVPSDRTTPWKVSHEYISTRPSYGDKCYAIRNMVGGTKVTIGSSFTTEADWLQAFYYNAYPLTDSTKESIVPKPTHFEVFQNGNKVSFPISDWNKQLSLGFAPAKFSTLYIRFYRNIADNIVQLGVGACTVMD